MAAMADLGSGSHSSSAIAAHMDKAARQLSVRRDGLRRKGTDL
jgi:predicted RNA methylase